MRAPCSLLARTEQLQSSLRASISLDCSNLCLLQLLQSSLRASISLDARCCFTGSKRWYSMLTPVVKSRRVDLSNNTLRSIGGIRRLGSVVWLKCSGNKLGPSLLSLAGMSALRVLDVASNALDSLEGLGRSPLYPSLSSIPLARSSLYPSVYTPLHAYIRLFTSLHAYLRLFPMRRIVRHTAYVFSTASRWFATCCRRSAL